MGFSTLVCVGLFLVLLRHFREPKTKSGRGRVDRTIPGAVAPRWPPTPSFPLRLRVPGLTPAARELLGCLLPLEPELQHTSSERNGERGILEVLRRSPPPEPRRSPLLPASVLLPPLPFAMGPAPPGDPRLRRAAGLRGAEDGAF